jgi:hypothetical protein
MVPLPTPDEMAQHQVQDSKTNAELIQASNIKLHEAAVANAAGSGLTWQWPCAGLAAKPPSCAFRR